MKIHKLRFLRAIALPIISRLNVGDITIRHHYTGDPVRLHSYRHKGYWYHGKKRERSNMEMFARLLRKGDSVIEVGGHIGYISLYLKSLIGDGRLAVFEPGSNNLPYLRRNLRDKNIQLVEKAAGPENSTKTFYLDLLSGQNNSLVSDFKGLDEVRTGAFDKKAGKVTKSTVETVRLDDFIIGEKMKPTFVKIDVEGFEYEVLSGMPNVLRDHQPMLMIEIQVRFDEVGALLRNAGYIFTNARGEPQEPTRFANYFCLHREKHRAQIAELGISL